jgi:hypothetical protein
MADRICTSCQPKTVPAKFVASAAEVIPGHPMQWFECGEHEPTDNLAGELRVSLEPIEDWFKRHGLK